mmetsp:Transcript_44487/g.110742  ORF Transcript_44487/g.110742 Transcript_44487/m.110742 type:complete len:87 (+) Transcript_44487:213-473(+)
MLAQPPPHLSPSLSLSLAACRSDVSMRILPVRRYMAPNRREREGGESREREREEHQLASHALSLAAAASPSCDINTLLQSVYEGRE